MRHRLALIGQSSVCTRRSSSSPCAVQVYEVRPRGILRTYSVLVCALSTAWQRHLSAKSVCPRASWEDECCIDGWAFLNRKFLRCRIILFYRGADSSQMVALDQRPHSCPRVTPYMALIQPLSLSLVRLKHSPQSLFCSGLSYLVNVQLTSDRLSPLE